MVELLEHAQSCGIYDPVNYNETPVLYGSNYIRKNLSLHKTKRTLKKNILILTRLSLFRNKLSTIL